MKKFFVVMVLMFFAFAGGTKGVSASSDDLKNEAIKVILEKISKKIIDDGWSKNLFAIKEGDTRYIVSNSKYNLWMSSNWEFIKKPKTNSHAGISLVFRDHKREKIFEKRVVCGKHPELYRLAEKIYLEAEKKIGPKVAKIELKKAKEISFD